MFLVENDEFFCSICLKKYAAAGSVKQHIRDRHQQDINLRFNPPGGNVIAELVPPENEHLGEYVMFYCSILWISENTLEKKFFS